MGLRATSPVTVGRHGEHARLDAVLGAVTGGQSVVVLVAGEAGVGKSRLVRELTARATARRFRVLTGWCVEFGEEVWPLAPLRDVVAALVDQLDGEALELVLGSARHELARLVPELGTDERSVEPLAIARLCELVMGVVRRAALRGPLVLVVEDLHWADPSTRALLAVVMSARDLGPVLLVGTYRSDELHRRHPLHAVLAAIERTARPERIDLVRLDAVSTAELVETLSPLAAEVDEVDAIYRRSGGNPFFIEELIAARTAGVAGPTETLREVILARAASLDDTAVQFLRVAAAAGSTVVEVLAAACGLEAGAFSSAFDAAVAAALVVVEGDEVRFRHELAREVFYDELLRGDRARVHADLARAVEMVRPDRAGEIARHWSAARDGARALVTSISAGRLALRSGAAAEAEGHFDRALDWWDNVPDAQSLTGVDRATLLAEGSIAAKHARHIDRATELSQQSIAELAGTDPIREGQQWLQLRDLYRITRRLDERAHAVERALALIPASPPTSARAEALASAAMVCWTSNHPDEGLVYAREAVTIADTLGHREMQVYSRVGVAIMLVLAGRPDEGLIVAEAAVALCNPDVSSERTLMAYDGLLIALAGERREDVGAIAERGVAIARDTGLGGIWGAWLAERWVFSLAWLGRWDEAERVVTEQLDLLDHPFDTGQLAIAWGVVLLRQGRLDEARPLIDDARAFLASESQDEMNAFLGAAVVELDTHDHLYHDAATLVTDVLEQSGRGLALGLSDLVANGAASQADRAELARARHDPDAAANAETETAAWIDQLEHDDRAEWRQEPDGPLHLDQAKAELARLRGRPDPDRWAQVAAGWETLKNPYCEAYARWRHAEAILAGTNGRTAAARHAAAAQLSAAQTIAERLHATPLLTNINDLARRARLSPAAVRPLHVAPSTSSTARADFGLTAREQEVLQMVAGGASNGEIAKALYINTKTASVHVSNILRKLGVTNRIEAAAVVATRSQLP
jgi:DNA-binding CsgD family transcriptional regulator